MTFKESSQPLLKLLVSIQGISLLNPMEPDRIQNAARLSLPQTGINDAYYLEYKHLFLDLQNAIRHYASGEILDIGCGNKPYLPFFQGRFSTYQGCDMVQSDRNCVDILCPATEIPLPDACKNTIFSTQVIEHVADHQKLLSEAFRILKPGGYLILSGPMYWEHHEIPHDFFRFTRYGFEYLLKNAGFQVQEIKANGGKWALAGQVLMNCIRSSYEKPGILRKIVKLFYFLLRIKWIINLGFSFLDKIDHDEVATLNFVVVARKA